MSSQGRMDEHTPEEAVRLARQCGDPVTLADALFALAVNLEGRRSPSRGGARRTTSWSGLAESGRAPAFGHPSPRGARTSNAPTLAAFTSTHHELGRHRRRDATVPGPTSMPSSGRPRRHCLEGRFDDVPRLWGEATRVGGRAGLVSEPGYVPEFEAFHLARDEGRSAMCHRQPGNPLTAWRDVLLRLGRRSSMRAAGESARGGSLHS